MAAHYNGNKVSTTQRFNLGKLLGATTRHFLLMTATPHNGKEEDFQLFLSLLDGDRFYGRFRDVATRLDVSDVMRRMVKEDLVKFDGTKLFPERVAVTARYELSSAERALYDAVTTYVREQMDQADRLEDGSQRNAVGFALTTLQRRLASSPEAIYQSLKRRVQKLKRRLDEERRGNRSPSAGMDTMTVPEDLDDLTSDEQEQLEEQFVDQASASRTIHELENEIAILELLEAQARRLAHNPQDRKWEQLSRLLQDTPEMRDADGKLRKLIIFTEHRDTLRYLSDNIGGLLGDHGAVVVIDGSTTREKRREVQEKFRNEPAVRVLVATDAAGEGVNLQTAHLMVNYDLPWNPNRLEQRFGRIHRIGQTEVCRMWNMMAANTREGDVFASLFHKLEIERQALGGRVFDILGEVFEEKSLRDLLIEAIREGQDPSTRERLQRQVETVFDPAHLQELIRRNALYEEIMDEARLFAVKEEMEKAEARKLQPYFIRSFFSQAFAQLGGELRLRERGRWEIAHVPAIIRERDKALMTHERRNLNPVVRSYTRVCFERGDRDVPGKPKAELIHPAHPLMQAVTDLMLERHRPKLKQGAVLVDKNDTGLTPRVLFMIDHAIKEGGASSELVSRRVQFVSVQPATLPSEGSATEVQLHAEIAGWAPHLDLEPIQSDDLACVKDVLAAPWIANSLEQIALTYASEHIVPEHFAEVSARRARHVDKTLTAVHERLTREINYQSSRFIEVQDLVAKGRQPKANLDNVRREIDDLSERLKRRTAELRAMRDVVSATPLIVGGALIIPAGLLAQRRGEPESESTWIADAAARKQVEQLAMQAVMNAERALGHTVLDVSAEKCGWDVTSIPPARDGLLPQARHIEVKGRAKGQTTITVTRNEIVYALNQQDKFILAVVMVDGDRANAPRYIRQPFAQEPEWGVSSVNYALPELLQKSESI